MIKTKIVCTIGPSSCTYENIIELIQAGMNIARLNFSHGSHQSHLEVINHLKKARAELNVPLAIMLDTCGPEVRVGDLPKEGIRILRGEQWLLVAKGNSREKTIPVEPFFALKEIEKGVRILYDDGYVASRVVNVSEEGVLVEFESNGILKTHKGVNIPNFEINLPALTDKDIEDIKFGCENDIDILAASFVRSADHVRKIKKHLHHFNGGDILVVAKIENHQGINNFDEILEAADGIMVARGDLGVEVNLSHVPRLQKEMILKCFSKGKPAITATQMLESMMTNPRPTRAEVSDVANAIYDSTSAVMLSGETAAGSYPIESVQTMREIIVDTEAYFDFKNFFYTHLQKNSGDVPSAITFATVNTAYATNAEAIFVFTSSGYTARLIAKWRSEVPVLVLTNNKKVYHQLSINWGIVPIYHPKFESVKEAYDILCKHALEQNIVNLGDTVVVTAGSAFGVSGSTNMLFVENIGGVALRAKFGYGDIVCDKISIVSSLEDALKEKVLNKILVINRCDDSYLNLLKSAKGIILENHPDDLDSEKYAMLVSKTMNLPLIVRAQGASITLKEGQTVTLDPKEFLVYHGSVALKH